MLHHFLYLRQSNRLAFLRSNLWFSYSKVLFLKAFSQKPYICSVFYVFPRITLPPPIICNFTESSLHCPDYGGSLLQKAWILPRLPCQGDKAVCGWQAERFQFHAKNLSRRFEQRARSEIVSMR